MDKRDVVKRIVRKNLDQWGEGSRLIGNETVLNQFLDDVADDIMRDEYLWFG